MTSASEGVVLQATPVRDADLLVVLYTAAHGRVSAIARGARTSRRRFGGALQRLVLGRYQLGRRPRGDLWGLDAADVVREWTRLASDVVAVAHASYATELVSALLPPEAPEPEVLGILTALWDSLAERGPSPAALRAVELALLDVAGHRPVLDACAACSAAELERGAIFDPSRGGAICQSCAAASRGVGVRPIDAATLDYLRAVAEVGSPSAAWALDRDARVGAAERAAGRDALVAMVQCFVGKPLKSLEYIAKLRAAYEA